MKIVREDINERMGFTEDSDPIEDMGIGMPFGFTSKMLGLETNDGKHSIYVKAEFIEKICTPGFDPGIRWLKDGFKSRYGDRTYYKDKSKWPKLQFSCSFGFKKYKDGDIILYRVYGVSGSHGFFGGQQTEREKLAPTHIKHCLEDLYLHLEKLLNKT